MATGIVQKSYKALFPLRSLKKKDIGKNILKQRKRQNYIYLIFSKTVANLIFGLI